MSAGAERKVVLVTRRTRLQDLVARHHTLAQARFCLDRLGASLDDYLAEDRAYRHSLLLAREVLSAWGRHQELERSLLPNYVFAPDDIVVAMGQDGLVANTLKYLGGQPLIGLNPEPVRWDGPLLPFEAGQLGAVLKDVAAGKRARRAVTMAQARLSDGQELRAVNDLFIGPRSHTSALYEIASGARRERQCSSGVIIATGLGSTAWLKSVVTGSQALAAAAGGPPCEAYQPMAWDTPQLAFVVREPFPTQRSQATLVYGRITPEAPLTLRSQMPEHGVIFSDGIEADYLRFPAGVEVTVRVAPTQGMLVA